MRQPGRRLGLNPGSVRGHLCGLLSPYLKGRTVQWGRAAGSLLWVRPRRTVSEN